MFDTLQESIDYLGSPKILVVEGYDCVGKNRVLDELRTHYEHQGKTVLFVDPDWPMLDPVMRRNDRWLVMLSILASFSTSGIPERAVFLFNRSVLTGYAYYMLEHQRFGLSEQSQMTLDQVRFALSQFTDAMNRLGGAILLIKPSEDDYAKLVETRRGVPVDEAGTGASPIELFRSWYEIVDTITPLLATAFPVATYTNPFVEG